MASVAGTNMSMENEAMRGPVMPSGSERHGRSASALPVYVIVPIAVAATIRFIVLFQTSSVPSTLHPIGDAKAYLQWADRIAAGDWIGSEAFYQAPLYPYVLASIRTVLGNATFAIRLVQIIWSIVGLLLLAMAVRRLFGKREATLAAMFLALYAPAIFFDIIIQKTSLASLLVGAVFYSLARYSVSATAVTSFATGLTSGLLTLTRENALVWVPLIILWLAIQSTSQPLTRRKSRLVLSLIAFIGGLLMTIGIVSVRNRIVAGTWSFSTYQSGSNFYIGNSKAANGRYVPLVPGHETPAHEREDAVRLAEAAAGRTLNPREVSRYWHSRAWSEIGEDPARWVRLLGVKLAMTFRAHEVADAESLYVHAAYSPVLRVVSRAWHFGVLCPLAVVGLWSTRGQWRRLWILYAMIASMAASIALFYVMARYRFPLVLLLLPFAAAGCVSAWDAFRRMQWGELIIFAVIGGVSALGVNAPVHDEEKLIALSWMNMGVALAEQGELEEAVAVFGRAVEQAPTSAEANYNLATTLAVRGDFVRAITYYERAVLAQPSLPNLHYNYAVALEQIGRAGDAIKHFRAALQADPNDAEAGAALRRLGG